MLNAYWYGKLKEIISEENFATLCQNDEFQAWYKI
jgi:hypothetical protein